MIIDKNIIKEILVNDGLDDSSIEGMLSSYPEELDSRLDDSYTQYIVDGTVLDVEFEGLTLTGIIESRKCHFFVALRDMSKLMSTEEGSEDMETWKRILTSPLEID